VLPRDMRILATLFLAAMASATVCLADPCKAIPDRGPMPAWLRRGATFSGPVVYVGDGDGLCVAATPGRERDPMTWVEVRVADFYAPELHEAGGPKAKAALERLTRGRRASCVADHRSYDRIVARCSVDGRDIGDQMRRAGIAEGGNAWRH
jgi:micrococcal nuclease